MPSRASILLGLSFLGAGCGDSPTGLHLVVRLGTLEYDELRFGVVLMQNTDAGVTSPGATLVDPSDTGRYVAPFQPGDQDVYVHLSPALNRQHVRSQVVVMMRGGVIGTDEGDALVQSGRFQDVYLDLNGGTGMRGPAETGSGGSMSGDAASAGGSGGDAGGGASGGVGSGGAAGGGAGGAPGTPPPPVLPPTSRPNGASCSSKLECKSDSCVDGVCCESACDKECTSCALAGMAGLCRSVAAGTPDPRRKCQDKGAATCQTSGRCDVAGRCADYPAGTVCAPATCENNNEIAVAPRTCDGSGKCSDPVKVECRSRSCSAGVCR